MQKVCGSKIGVISFAYSEQKASG